jgi:Amt family ammonium transporter
MKNFITILTVLLALFVSPIIAQDNPAETPATATPAGTGEPAEPEGGDVTEEGEDASKTEEEEGEGEDPNPTFDYANTSGADSGDTAWMIVATALVLLMTIPGLSLFYGGLTRRKNVLSVLVQCFACVAVMSLLWVIYGYSFATSGDGKFFGDLSVAFLKGVGPGSMSGSIPESVFITFQMTFAVITPALIVGAFAERMKFSAVMIFLVIWFTFSYCPVWHMVWNTDVGYLATVHHSIDFAGGTVVHINAGIAALVACIVLGKRKGFPDKPMPPHNVPFVLIGAALLWVGWFGFNAGSALTAGNQAGMAQLVTQVATAAAAFAWMMVEWIKRGKPTAIGIATGAVAGLVAVTPASGSVGPMGSIAIGIAAGVVCYWASTSLKKALGYDDSFDVFGVHGVGGIVGALLTGVFAISADGAEMIKNQVSGQVISVIVTIVWSGVVAFIAIKIADVCCGGIRSSEDDETEGLDLADHGEDGYQL